MRKLFVLTIILTLVLAGCEDGDTVHISTVIYKIGDTGPGGGTVFFAEGGQYKECSGELGTYNWSDAKKTAGNYKGGGFSDWRLPDRGELDLMYENLHSKGLGGFSNTYYWSSTKDSTSYYDSAWSKNFGAGTWESAYQSNSHRVRAVRSGQMREGTTSSQTLTIKNESFTEITDVIWQNVSFANSQYENSIRTGTGVTNTVEPGAGYIFFKRESNPITARTLNLIIVEEDKDIEFTFTDNTLIVEANNTSNTGTLGALQSTVVWWDDAEGEMQPYYLLQSTVEYYTGSAAASSTGYYHAPKNGSKAIRIGRTNTALMQLRINLEKRAQLSFWYANYFSGTAGTTFSINGEEKAKWTVDINWSQFTIDLEPGVNDLVWAKKDGYVSSVYRYLSLDDILIYYTE